MNRITTIDEELRQIEFAKEAGTHFSKFPEHASYGDLQPGSFLALRWGMLNDCVLVLKLDEDFIPTNYQ